MLVHGSQWEHCQEFNSHKKRFSFRGSELVLAGGHTASFLEMLPPTHSNTCTPWGSLLLAWRGDACTMSPSPCYRTSPCPTSLTIPKPLHNRSGIKILLPLLHLARSCSSPATFLMEQPLAGDGSVPSLTKAALEPGDPEVKGSASRCQLPQPSVLLQ